MPRRRFQRGRLVQRGKVPKWVGMFREDRLQPTFKRIRRTVTLGPCSSMSRRAALAALQPYLDAVNVTPAPAQTKTGKTCLDAVQEWRQQIAVNLKPSTVRAVADFAQSDDVFREQVAECEVVAIVDARIPHLV